MKLKSIDLHSPLFVGSKNFKTYVQAAPGLDLSCDETETRFTVKWNGAIKHLPFTSVAAYEFEDSVLAKPNNKTSPQISGIIKAQVSDPSGVAVARNKP